MGLKESGLRGSLLSVSTGVRAIPDSGLARDYDARNISASADDSITTWPEDNENEDASGSGTYKEDFGPDNLPSVLLDGSNDGFVANPVTTETQTIAVVYQFEDDGFDHLVGNHEADENGIHVRTDGSSEIRITHDGEANVGTGENWDANANILIVAHNADDDTTVVDLNNSEINRHTTNVIQPGNNAELNIGVRESGDERSNVRVSHVRHYDSYYDDEDRTELHDALASEWGL